MNLTIARILLYVLAGALLNAGWLNEELAEFIRTDPDVQALAGGLVLVATVAWWRLAKRFGWKT